MGKRYIINVEHVVHEAIDGEAVLVNLQNGNYYSTTGTGAAIWADLEKGLQPEALLQSLRKRCEGDPAAMESGLQHFLEGLLAEQLILADDSGAASGAVPREEPGRAPSEAEEKIPYSPPLLQRYSDMQELLLLDPIHDVDESGWPVRSLSEDT